MSEPRREATEAEDAIDAARMDAEAVDGEVEEEEEEEEEEEVVVVVVVVGDWWFGFRPRFFGSRNDEFSARTEADSCDVIMEIPGGSGGV